MSEESEQIKKFRDKAKEIDCDSDESTFDDKLRQIVKSPPKLAKRDKEEAPE